MFIILFLSLRLFTIRNPLHNSIYISYFRYIFLKCFDQLFHLKYANLTE